MEGTARVAFSAARPRPPTPVGVEGASPRFRARNGWGDTGWTPTVHGSVVRLIPPLARSVLGSQIGARRPPGGVAPGGRSVVGQGSATVQRRPAPAQRDGVCFPFTQTRSGCSPPIASGNPQVASAPGSLNRSMHSGAVAGRCWQPPRGAATVSEPPAQGRGRGLVQPGPVGTGLPARADPPSGLRHIRAAPGGRELSRRERAMTGDEQGATSSRGRCQRRVRRAGACWHDQEAPLTAELVPLGRHDGHDQGFCGQVRAGHQVFQQVGNVDVEEGGLSCGLASQRLEGGSLLGLDRLCVPRLVIVSRHLVPLDLVILGAPARTSPGAPGEGQP